MTNHKNVKISHFLRHQEVPRMELPDAATVLPLHRSTKWLRTQHKHEKENVRTVNLKKVSRLHGCNTLMQRRDNHDNVVSLRTV